MSKKNEVQLNAKDILASWESLNNMVKGASEKECQELLTIELQTEKRKMFVLRVHSRLNRMRAARERVELCGKL